MKTDMLVHVDDDSTHRKRSCDLQWLICGNISTKKQLGRLMARDPPVLRTFSRPDRIPLDILDAVSAADLRFNRQRRFAVRLRNGEETQCARPGVHESSLTQTGALRSVRAQRSRPSHLCSQPGGGSHTAHPRCHMKRIQDFRSMTRPTPLGECRLCERARHSSAKLALCRAQCRVGCQRLTQKDDEMVGSGERESNLEIGPTLAT